MPMPNAFAVFDLRPTFDLDTAELHRRYLDRVRASHPDFHAGDAEAVDRGTADSATLNDAYRRLKEPFARAEELMRVWAGPSGEELKDLPPGFLEEMLERRMEVEELKDDPDPAATRRLTVQVHGDRDAALAAVGDACRTAESSEAEAKAAAIAKVRLRLNTVRYFDRLLDELS